MYLQYRLYKDANNDTSNVLKEVLKNRGIDDHYTYMNLDERALKAAESVAKNNGLNEEVKKMGCNKVAYAHHKDDIIETMFMSLIYEGRIHTFAPVTYLSRKDIHIIRPMVYVPEKEASKNIIISLKNLNNNKNYLIFFPDILQDNLPVHLQYRIQPQNLHHHKFQGKHSMFQQTHHHPGHF